MDKIFKLFFLLIFFFLFSCSFSNRGGFFEDKLKNLEEEVYKKNSKLIFAPEKKFREEISGKTKKGISRVYENSDWPQNNFSSTNFIPNLFYTNKKELSYKSKKLGKNKFRESDIFFEPIIFENDLFFYDVSGNVYKFSIKEKKISWKYNFYKKRYKNTQINLKLIISNRQLIVSDNLGYIYSLSDESGKLNWAKNYGVPFTSNIKIENGNIFLLNQDNKYYVLNEFDGEKITSLETFPSFLKSNQETNISLDSRGNVYFITSSGEMYSINFKTGNLNWFTSLGSGSMTNDTELFFSSPIVFEDNKLYFSSSISTFSINTSNGTSNWKLPFGTYLKPVVTEHHLFLSSKDGFFISLDKKTGKVIWSKDLFNITNKLNKKKVGEINSLILISDQLLLSTTGGYFFFIDYRNGKIKSYTKASGSGFFSKSIISNKKIFVLDKKMRILIFN